MSWEGHELGEHMRQSHGPDAVKAFAKELRTMEIFCHDGLVLSEFEIQFPELSMGDGLYQMISGGLRQAAIEKGWRMIC
jgi:hypothetical protein